MIAVALSVLFAASFILAKEDQLDVSANQIVPSSSRYDRVGDTREFNIYDYSGDRNITLPMECIRIGRYVRIYKESTVDVTDGLLNRIRDEFDYNIYPANKNFAGTGLLSINGDDRLSVLLLRGYRGRPANLGKKAVAGYYSQENEQLTAYRNYSNESKIIHVFIDESGVTEEAVIGTVVHETRHLKNWGIAKTNVGFLMGGIFAIATILTLYLGLSHLYVRGIT